MSFTELDILITMLETTFDIEDTWNVENYLDGPKVTFYNSHHEEIASAVCNSDSFGHEEGLIEVTGKPLCDDEYNGVEGWLTAEEVYSRWANYVMKEN